ncbi:MAG: hypothetical protein AAGJ08_23985 [Cyanobacteria bacterium P01_H01_bin.35]
MNNKTFSEEATAIMYFIKDGEKMVLEPNYLSPKSTVKRHLQTSYQCGKFDEKREIGRRLTMSIFGAPGKPATEIPTGWVVTDVCRYSPDEGQTPLFKDIVLAFCVYKPMTPDEVKNFIEPIGLMPVTVESFGGDEQKYQEWLKSEKKAMNVGHSK